MIGQEIGRGVLLGALVLIEDDLDLDATLMGIEQDVGDRPSLPGDSSSASKSLASSVSRYSSAMATRRIRAKIFAERCSHANARRNGSVPSGSASDGSGAADVGAFLVGIDYPLYLGSISGVSVGAGGGYGHRLRSKATRPIAPRAAYIGVLSGSIVALIVVLPVGVLEARCPDLRARNP